MSDPRCCNKHSDGTPSHRTLVDYLEVSLLTQEKLENTILGVFLQNLSEPNMLNSLFLPPSFKAIAVIHIRTSSILFSVPALTFCPIWSMEVISAGKTCMHIHSELCTTLRIHTDVTATDTTCVCMMLCC